MKVTIRGKFDTILLEYYVGQKGNSNYQKVPNCGDTVEIDDERYVVVNRTFIPQDDSVILQVWQPLIDDPDL